MYRVVSGPRWYLHAISGATALRRTDDAYGILLNDVSLTVTPASEANSLESGGIRVDGDDECTQLPVCLTRSSGSIRFRVVVRQLNTIQDVFRSGSAAQLAAIRLDANNYIRVRLWVADLQLAVNSLGAGVATDNWTPASWAPGDEYLMYLEYGTFGVRLFVDGIQRCSVAGPMVFESAPVILDWGTYWSGTQGDIVIKEP